MSDLRVNFHQLDTLWQVTNVKNGLVTKATVRRLTSEAEQEIHLSKYIYLTAGKSPFNDSDGISGDVLIIERNEKGEIEKIDKILDDGFGGIEKAYIYPYYSRKEPISISPNATLSVSFKEITEEREYQHTSFLDQFHYLDTKSSWGRQQYLIATFEPSHLVPNPPPLIGYLILNSPGLLSKQRNLLLDWTSKEISQHVDRIVRIARVIVHPEYRGIGIGTKLVQHALKYAKDHWNVVGLKPWLVETVAEMSRYHPFFEKAGMLQFGETEGFFNVRYIPKEEIESKQGKGHLRASTDRMKLKIHTKKPYFAYPLNEKIAKIVHEKIPSTSQNVVRIEPSSKRKPPLIQLVNISVQHQRQGLWREAMDICQEWACVNKLAAEKYEQLKQFLRKIIATLDGKTAKLSSFSIDKNDGFFDEFPDLSVLIDEIEEFHQLLSYPFSYSNHLLSSVEKEITDFQGKIEKIQLVQGRLVSDFTQAIEQVEQILIKCLRQLKDPSENCPQNYSELSSALNQLRVLLIELRKAYSLAVTSKKEQDVEAAFGVKPATATTICRSFNFDFLPGQIILIVGSSGSGKSSFLDALSGKVPLSGGDIYPKNLLELVGVLDLQFEPKQSLIDLLSGDTHRAIYNLNAVGLSEAHLYVKKREELSHGQRYRAAIAMLLNSEKPVWIADEFCALLDPLTAMIVSKSVRKIVKEWGVTLIAAVSRSDYIQNTLQPDVVIRMTTGGLMTPNPSCLFWKKGIHLSEILTALEGFRMGEYDCHECVLPIMKKLDYLETKRTPNGIRYALSKRGEAVLAHTNEAEKIDCILTTLCNNDLILHRLYNLARYEETKNLLKEPPSISKLIEAAHLDYPYWRKTTLKKQVEMRIRFMQQT